MMDNRAAPRTLFFYNFHFRINTREKNLRFYKFNYFIYNRHAVAVRLKNSSSAKTFYLLPIDVYHIYHHLIANFSADI